ncbi:MAG: hypothetical protein Kow00121_57880 [Elainellaceae cyanobacterium]
MLNSVLPHALEQILSANDDPDLIFSALMPALGEALQCDRCFLYLRNPDTSIGRVPYCWRRSNKYPEIYDPDWKLEPASLAQDDPLFAAALRTEASVFVEDVETASAEQVNRDFEREQFGHRALIHAHLCHSQQLWGILQPCIFGQPRQWSEADRNLIHEVVNQITPKAIAYVQMARCV